MFFLRFGLRLNRTISQSRFLSTPLLQTGRSVTARSTEVATPRPSRHVRPVRAAAQRLNYCRECGETLTKCIPPDDSRERLVCQRCGFIDYMNPKIVPPTWAIPLHPYLQVVGCIVEHEDRILLCSRGIEPCKGMWTLPAGFLEIGESTISGAARETLEEANATVSVLSLFSMMEVPVIGQCHIIYRAKLEAPFHISPGVETLETKLVRPRDVNLKEIAFTSILETLKAYSADRELGRYRFHQGVIVRRPDASPKDAKGYTLENYLVQ